MEDSLLGRRSGARRADLDRFYELLAELEARLGGKRRLSECTGRMEWPERGVYFFFEEGELRQDGRTPRVVRVGTHALTSTSRTTLWKRLVQHRGNLAPAGGNHRGSIFRLIVGEALLRRGGLPECASLAAKEWGRGSTPPPAARERERPLELEVSRVLGAMPFLWLSIPDDPGSGSQRGIIERNSIALLSNWEKEPLDSASPSWLGHNSPRRTVQLSGLWNQNHVAETYSPAFLEILGAAIAAV